MVRAVGQALAVLADAAADAAPVVGLTHNFYRYPARFSPQFAAAAIRSFSRPGDLILDPYMGGGTTLVEAMAAGRRAIGNDLNTLAAFVTRVKVTPLRPLEVAAVQRWASNDVPRLRYSQPPQDLAAYVDPHTTRNLTLPRSRFIKKIIATSLAALSKLPTPHSRAFARCAVLRVGQWALDGRKRPTAAREFRGKLVATTSQMLDSIASFASCAKRTGGSATILCRDTATLEQSALFRDSRNKAALVVTSPPYPGVHVLYHRWQVDGRRETPAPYWISGCRDGESASFYSFGNRHDASGDEYFSASLRTLRAIRRVMKHGGFIVQLVGFNRPKDQLPRYLENMKAAGFTEVSRRHHTRIWRPVPNRKWHATLKGPTPSSREVVLVHRAS